jgi:hypothetical protein
LPDGELTQVPVELIAGGAIRGRVMRADGSPMVRQRLILCDASVGPGTQSNGWAEEGTGSFAFVGLADGEYKLAAADWQHLGSPWWWYPGTRDWDEATAIVIARHEEIADIELQLPE